MKTGIANSVLVEQVRNTAAWLWSLPQAAAVTALFDAASDGDDAEDASAHVTTFRLRLAAHYATVATFVPTDVDAHIRHHAWMAIDGPDTFAAARGRIDEAAARDAALVSARVTLGLSGHDGEWLSVRAGALGRALMLGFADEAQALAERIDAELEREERLFADAVASGAPARVTLALATTLAHNLGDLSRVVDAWPKALAEHEIKRRFSRLGHADAPVRRPAFVLAGVLNKELMALENHRFLALRKPRALRRSRELLLPLGPWFDAWGELVGATPLVTDDERGEVVTALIELHQWSPSRRAASGRSRAFTVSRAAGCRRISRCCPRGCARRLCGGASAKRSTCGRSISRRASRSAFAQRSRASRRRPRWVAAAPSRRAGAASRRPDVRRCSPPRARRASRRAPTARSA